MGGHGSGAPSKFALHNLPDPDRLLYDRQPEETDKAWFAFVAYRGLGPERSLGKVVDKLGKEPKYLSQIEKWSALWSWRERAAEWDREVDKQSRRAQLAAAVRVSNEMAAVAESMWKLAARDLVKWHQKLEAASDVLLSPSDLQKLVDTGMKLHRLSIGESDARTDVNVKSDGSLLTRVVFVSADKGGAESE